MSSELFRTRKHFAALKRDTQRAIDQFKMYPHAEKLKALELLERGFRKDAADLGVFVQDIESAAKKLFVKQTGDVV
jgi:hypothetical protein